MHLYHLDLGMLERAEAPFYHHSTLATTGGILQADGVVVGLDLQLPSYWPPRPPPSNQCELIDRALVVPASHAVADDNLLSIEVIVGIAATLAENLPLNFRKHTLCDRRGDTCQASRNRSSC